MENVVGTIVETFSGFMIAGTIAGFLIYNLMSALGNGIYKVVHLIDIN